jgi:hypothetical protein
MKYAILCYHDEAVTCAWSKEHDDAVMEKLAVVHGRIAASGKLGPVARLLPTSAATTVRGDREPALVLDGPFAETKEQLLGFYVVDCDDLEEAIAFARELGQANPGRRLRDPPDRPLQAGHGPGMTDEGWIGAVLAGARPQAVAALLRWFRDLDRPRRRSRRPACAP